MKTENKSHSKPEILKDHNDQGSDKDFFIANLSHELRTPLNNIIGWLQLYKEKMAKDDELRQLHDTIDQNSRQLLALVSDLLEASKIGSGKIELNKKVTNLTDLIQRILDKLEPEFAKYNLRTFIQDNREPFYCEMDSSRVEQVIQNIFQNSIKFSTSGGTIEVRLRQEEGFVVVSIIDNGRGIEPANLEKLFKRFHQVENGWARKNSGLGLGLAISKDIIELHSGKISITSQGVGLGTRVEFSLPLVEQRKIEQCEISTGHGEATPQSSVAKFNGLRLLLVEDSAESARFLTLFLSQMGFEVTWAQHAIDGFNFLQKTSYDIVLSDIGLPGIDGYEFLESATKISKNEATPFVAISAYGSKEEVRRSLEVGFVDHIIKPVEFNDLVRCLRKILFQ